MPYFAIKHNIGLIVIITFPPLECEMVLIEVEFSLLKLSSSWVSLGQPRRTRFARHSKVVVFLALLGAPVRGM